LIDGDLGCMEAKGADGRIHISFSCPNLLIHDYEHFVFHILRGFLIQFSLPVLYFQYPNMLMSIALHTSYHAHISRVFYLQIFSQLGKITIIQTFFLLNVLNSIVQVGI
jgi:hypothetical protein